jgi:gamma-glutamyl:cysteine ligase YbdK (ATP-grasp superfamily)
MPRKKTNIPQVHRPPMTNACKFPKLRAAALRSFAASQLQTPATSAEARAQAWRNRLKLTHYENSAAAREEQALADIYDEIFEYNRQLKAMDQEGKDWDDFDHPA